MLFKGIFIPKEERYSEGISEVEARKILDEFLSLVKRVSISAVDRAHSEEQKLKALADVFVAATDFLTLSTNRQNLSRKIFQKYAALERIRIEDKNVIEWLRKQLYVIPADTRPGPNSSSLINHLRHVSAIAFCIARQRGLEGVMLQQMRLAALLHDIGKPALWIEGVAHPKAAKEIFENTFSGVLSLGSVRAISALIEAHMEPRKAGILEDYARIISEADVLASALDRIREIATKVISEDARKEKITILADLNEEKFEDWNFWRRLNPDTVHWATEVFMKNLDGYVLEHRDEFLSWDRLQEEKPEIALIYGDARRIKEYVDKVALLAEMIGGSLLVTKALSNIVLGVAEQHALESVIYYGGGMILVLAPLNLASNLESIIRNVFEESVNKGCRFSTVSIPFGLKSKSTFGALWLFGGRKLAFKKHSLEYEREEPVLGGYTKKCGSCGTRPAVYYDSTKELYLCEACRYKLDFGRGDRAERLENLKNLAGDISLILEFLPEFIAGHTIEDLHLFKRRKDQGEKVKAPEHLNFGIIKADGNLMGEFMAKSISITQLVEKSMAIDHAMTHVKNELFMRIGTIDKEALKNGLSDGLNNIRLNLGEVYADSDDLLWVVPGWFAFLAALIVADSFYKSMGGVATLSVAVVMVDPRYPLYSAMDVESHVLKEAKERARKTIPPIKTGGQAEDYLGVIDFEIIETGSASGEVFSSVRRALIKASLTSRAYVIGKEVVEGKLPNIEHLIKLTTGFNGSEGLMNNVIPIMSNLEEEKGKQNQYLDQLKARLRVLRDVGSILKSTRDRIDEERRLAIAYAVRQSVRSLTKEDASVYYDALKLLRSDEFNKPHYLIDSLLLLKILGGGRL